MRSIPAGAFLMGSPEGEPGRWNPAGGDGDDWSPELKLSIPPTDLIEATHTVTLTQNFWILDTPVTQALWQAVMGDNPSFFISPDRPVEQVSWDDAMAFVQQLNLKIDGFEAQLPTEAQWEYACRAGTQTATHGGPIEILAASNAPALDAIAWYAGNSAQHFELDNGEDARDWPDRQYGGDKAGTHPVARKAPNQWGVYDMLGNVYEWCFDRLAPYPADAVTDPAGPATGRNRIIRGGSWQEEAQYCRAAARSADDPPYKYRDLGFRIVCPSDLVVTGSTLADDSVA